MISIRKEIDPIANGKTDRQNNLLKMRPTPRSRLLLKNGIAPTRASKPRFRRLDARTQILAVGREDRHVYGDRNLFCSCPPIEEFEN